MQLESFDSWFATNHPSFGLLEILTVAASTRDCGAEVTVSVTDGFKAYTTVVGLPPGYELLSVPELVDLSTDTDREQLPFFLVSISQIPTVLAAVETYQTARAQLLGFLKSPSSR